MSTPQNKSYFRQYYLSNKSEIDAYKKEWYSRNKSKIVGKRKKHRQKNKEKIRLAKKAYYLKNKQRIRQKHKKYYQQTRNRRYEYVQNKLQTDINYRLSHSLRRRMNNAIRNNQKIGSAVKDLGCSISHFKSYIEKQWVNGMSWENYGKEGWHLDHIIPLASFDLNDREQFLKACHYTNHQPLWAEENLTKGNRI